MQQSMILVEGEKYVIFQRGVKVDIDVHTVPYLQKFGKQDIDVWHAMFPFVQLGQDV